MTTTLTLKEQLLNLHACEDAIKWVGDKTLEQAWQECHRGDWMLWIYRKSVGYNFQLLTLTKGHCANTVRHLMKDKRSTDAVDMAIKFGEGNATRDELNAYDDAAAYADADADAAYTAYAAYAADAAAAYAAYAADAAAAYAAYAAAYAAAAYAAADGAAAAAAAAAYAAYAAAYDAAAYDAAARSNARKYNQKATADICRKYLPIPIL